MSLFPIGGGFSGVVATATSTLATVTAGQSGTYTGYDNYGGGTFGSIAGGPLLDLGSTLLAQTNQPSGSVVVISLFFTGDVVDDINNSFTKLVFDGDDYLLSAAVGPSFVSGGSPAYTTVEWVFTGGSYTGTVMVSGNDYNFKLE